MEPPATPTRPLRVYRAVLVVYPGAFRRRYAAQMEAAFMADLHAARAAGRSVLGFWPAIHRRSSGSLPTGRQRFAGCSISARRL